MLNGLLIETVEDRKNYSITNSLICGILENDTKIIDGVCLVRNDSLFDTDVDIDYVSYDVSIIDDSIDEELSVHLYRDVASVVKKYLEPKCVVDICLFEDKLLKQGVILPNSSIRIDISRFMVNWKPTIITEFIGGVNPRLNINATYYILCESGKRKIRDKIVYDKTLNSYLCKMTS